MNSRSLWLAAAALVLPAALVSAQVSAPSRLELDRKGETIALEAYAPNIVRVTLSLQREPALAAPGYGVIAKPAAAGWSAAQTAQSDTFSSSALSVSVDRPQAGGWKPLQTQIDIGRYFGGSTPGAMGTLLTGAMPNRSWPRSVITIIRRSSCVAR